MRASPAAEWLGAPADRAGRLQVKPDLTVPGHPDIFAIGDTVTINGPDGKPVPGIAPAAKQQGRYVADTIKARLRGEHAAAVPLQACRQPGADRQAQAVIDFGRFKLRGALAWWIWGIAHIYFLIGLRNRLSVAHQLAVDPRPRPARRAADHARQQQGGGDVLTRSLGAGALSPRNRSIRADASSSSIATAFARRVSTARWLM